MFSRSVEFVEIRCSYVEVPHTMLKLKRMGFDLDDIVKVRVSATEYLITAQRDI